MSGVIYSKHLVLGKYKDFKHEMKLKNASSKNVHKTYINSFYEYLTFNICDIHEGDILNIIDIGELMCFSEHHEDEVRGLAGIWLFLELYLK